MKATKSPPLRVKKLGSPWQLRNGGGVLNPADGFPERGVGGDGLTGLVLLVGLRKVEPDRSARS
jgi:hypothetical protein